MSKRKKWYSGLGHISYSWEIMRAGLTLLLLGLIIGAIKPAAPATAFFTAVVSLCTIYFTKRVVKEKLIPPCDKEETNGD